MTTVTTETSVTADAGARRRSEFLYHYAGVGIIAVIIIVFGLTQPHFLTFANLADILQAVSVSAFLALGVTFSLVVEGFDVSIASTASLAVIAATAAMVYYRQELAVAVLLPLALGAVVGLVNSFLIVRIKLPDLLATLAMLFIVNGVQETYTSGYSIYAGQSQPGHPAVGTIVPSFLYIGQGDVLGIPFAAVLLVGIVVVSHLFLTRTTTGRFMYLVGGNVEAARHLGLPIGRLRTYAYVISGVLAAIGGIVLASQIDGGQVSAGAPLLTDAVAAAYVGYSIFGQKRASVVGTLMGALLIGILLNGLTMMNVPYYAQDIIKGAIFVIALAFTYLRKNNR